MDELGKRLRDPDIGGAPFLRLGVLEGGLDAENVRRALSPLPPPTIIISTIPASVNTSSGVGQGQGQVQGQEEPRGLGIMPDVGLRRDVLDLSPAGGVAVELAYQPRKTPLLALVDQVNAFPMPLMSRPPSPGSVVASNAPASGGAGGEASRLPVKHAHTHLTNPRPNPPPPSSAPTSAQQPTSSSRSEPALSTTSPPTPSKKVAAPWVAVEGVEILLEQGYEQVRLWTTRRAPQAKIRADVLREFERHVQQGLA